MLEFIEQFGSRIAGGAVTGGLVDVIALIAKQGLGVGMMEMEVTGDACLVLDLLQCTGMVDELADTCSQGIVEWRCLVHGFFFCWVNI